ncbi:hypothetical protein [Acidovorax temperans]|uniref:hypothetical protein n=1 Tax=Acidovorax temperans TaxID=80878 RepID=UPI00289875DD|nr:hypothetical protein [Acidovorax temperans]
MNGIKPVFQVNRGNLRLGYRSAKIIFANLQFITLNTHERQGKQGSKGFAH